VVLREARGLVLAAFPYMLAIEVAISRDIIALHEVLLAMPRSASWMESDALTSVALCLCCARLVVSCWTGKVAFNVLAGYRSERFAVRIGFGATRRGAVPRTR
jgi:hypothetical protein